MITADKWHPLFDGKLSSNPLIPAASETNIGSLLFIDAFADSFVCWSGFRLEMAFNPFKHAVYPSTQSCLVMFAFPKRTHATRGPFQARHAPEPIIRNGIGTHGQQIECVWQLFRATEHAL